MIDEKKAHYISVTGIIVKDEKYLIVKRAPQAEHFENLWTVPGGKIEKSDYKEKEKDTSFHWYNIFEKVLRREVKEETGIEIKNIRYLTSLSFFKKDGIPCIVVSLYADYAAGEIKLNKELVDFAWVSLEQAKKYNLIEGIYEEMQMLDMILKRKADESLEWKKNSEKEETKNENWN
jgi:8-oxo-dGTP pyrophosphatase MutT (NUDIX family)